MPRKASQPTKKDVASAETKAEIDAPRRSGRAVTKVEIIPVKEASRSRRSSTAAQTAASVADSRTPKGRASAGSHRESTPPSSSRTRGRDNAESPATRVKSTRRSTSHINYKESDGEEEATNPKFDTNFVSEEEFEESDSDEKSKGKARGGRTPSKKHSPKTKGKRAIRSQRGRPVKKKDIESEEETFDVTDDSVEPEGAADNEVKISTSRRGRRQKVQITEEKVQVSKGSRRSSRTASKEESPRKRPARGVQAKKYTEDDDDIEEISDTKKEEDKVDESRKRKRESSPNDANKKLKEEHSNVSESVSDKEEIEEISKIDDEEPEPMEIDDSKVDPVDDKTETVISKQEENPTIEAAPIIETEVAKSPNRESVVSNEVSSIETTEQKEKTRVDCSPVDFSNKEDTKVSDPITNEDSVHNEIHSSSSKVESEISQSTDDSELKNEQVSESLANKADSVPVISEELEKTHVDAEGTKAEVSSLEENMTSHEGDSVIPKDAAVGSSNQCQDSPLNGSETKYSQNEDTRVLPITHNAPSVNSVENQMPKANGEHNDTNLNSNEQYFSLPGRKFILNNKLLGTVHESLKNQTFGFVSFNLGSSSEVHVQKDKLLNELNSLNAHVICLQQVQKPFYTLVLDPAFDALGFKSVFSQPTDSLKGIVTFYKNSFFRLNGQSEVSLKLLIDKEIDASSLDAGEKSAVKSHVKKCGNVLFTHFCTLTGSHSITVANVQMPPTDLSIHALQMSCLAQEVIRINTGTSKPLLLGGEFNIGENDASYQLLSDGYLSDVMIAELQHRKDVSLPDKENTSLVNLLWKSFQHPSSNLRSCYKTVLDRELSIPEQKSTSADLIWFSSDNLHTMGVLDVTSDKPGDRHLSLKADIAFSV